MEINFECKKCNKEFDCDVGSISIDYERGRPIFEKDIICPQCGKRSIYDVVLSLVRVKLQQQPGSYSKTIIKIH